jgi:hypothetical protein
MGFALDSTAKNADARIYADRAEEIFAQGRQSLGA